MDKLEPQDILYAVQALKTSKVDKEIFYDLIAAEYARKMLPSEGQILDTKLNFAQKTQILESLVQGNASYLTIGQTLDWTLADYTEALFVLTRNLSTEASVIPLSEEDLDDMLDIGLYTGP